MTEEGFVEMMMKTMKMLIMKRMKMRMTKKRMKNLGKKMVKKEKMLKRNWGMDVKILV